MDFRHHQSEVMIYIHTNHPLVAMIVSKIIAVNSAWHVVNSLNAITSRSISDVDRLLIVDACCSSFSWPAVIRGGQADNLRTILLQPVHLQNTAEELRILLLGASGIVYASMSFEQELPRAIEAVLEGRLWVNQQVLTEYLRKTGSLFRQSSSVDRLTVREEQIFWLMTRGISNKKIGSSLGISERTVKFHISNILRKEHVSSRRALLSQSGDRFNSTGSAKLANTG